MTSCEIPLIRVTNPGDLIEAVPYLMGFHPAESLVLVGFCDNAGNRETTQLPRVRVTMRVDLPVEPLDLDSLAPLTQALDTSGCDAVVAIVISEEVRGDPRTVASVAALADVLVEDLSLTGLRVLDVLVATGQRWWSMMCANEACCPPDGVPRRLAGSVAAAELTLAGLVALPDREALAATLLGCSEAARAALLPAVAAAEQRRLAATDRAGRRRWQRTETAALLKAARRSDGAAISDEQLARFALALTDTTVRDVLWLAIDNGSVDGETLLAQLHARSPSSHVAPALFLFGWAQWRSGNGTLAMMAAEQALRSDPAYNVASLLIRAIQGGLDPRVAPPLGELSDLLSRPD